MKANLVRIAASVGRILLLLGIAVEVIGTVFINRFMFHPLRGGYSDELDGYVDIGTNGTRIAALVTGASLIPGRRVILYCHGNAEDMTGFQPIFEMLEGEKRGFSYASVDYPGYGLSDGAPDEEGCYRNVHRLYDWLVC